jgi:uncharacterized protein YjiS (DUF1127 family)
MTANLTLENAASSRSIIVVDWPLARVLYAMRTTFVGWIRTSEARRHLDQLDDRMLLDFGFDPEDARREAAKPFWKPFTLTRS